MKTTVVNKYKSSYDVDISRATKWGNIFSHQQNTKAKYTVSSREEAISKYKTWILGQPDLLYDLHELKGKRLGCTCKPKSCHGDVLAELANNLTNDKEDDQSLDIYW